MNHVAKPTEFDIDVGGDLYRRNADGALMPKGLIPEQRLLEDQLVRTIIIFAAELSAQIGRFKGHTADDIGAFQSLLQERYGAPAKGGRKGNVTFQSYDGLQKVEVRMADTMEFGPELQTAKSLIDAFIRERAAGADEAVRLLINQAFQVDQAGKINRNAVLALRTVPIEDEVWQRAMQAITDSIRVTGTKTYFRFSKRKDLGADWENIVIDLAGVGEVTA